MTATLQKLGSTVANAPHFTDSQAKDANHKHVSAVWTAQCLTFDAVLEKVAEDQRQIVDIRCPLKDWEPIVNAAGKFAFRHKPSGAEFGPTSKAVKDAAVIGGTSEWFINDLLTDKTKTNSKGVEKTLYKRDQRDAELLVHTFQNSLFAADRTDLNKVRLFRTWNNGTLRAMLSEQYAIVNNQWYIEALHKMIPGALFSHWRGDADTIFGNVLIPDSVREESDSHYGGMLSVGNSEIGLRRILSVPSVFRAICMNGCIWEQEKGIGVDQVHRGDIDYQQLERKIAANLQAQIPLLSEGIRRLLGTRALTMGDAGLSQVVAQFFTDFRIPKSLSAKYLGHFNTEVSILGNEARTAFGLQAALTRLGQELSNEAWVSFDEIAGKIVNMKPAAWDGLIARAKTLQAEDVTKALGDVAHLL
jgi:hypothetical protein